MPPVRSQTRAQQIAGGLDVLHREREEDLRRVVRRRGDLPQLRVVPVALGEGLLEDRRVRRDADDGVLLHHALELTGLEHLARERVEPDADAVLGQLMQP